MSSQIYRVKKVMNHNLEQSRKGKTKCPDVFLYLFLFPFVKLNQSLAFASPRSIKDTTYDLYLLLSRSIVS